MKINTFLGRINSYITYLGRSRVRDVLLRSSDRMLEDAGFSRDLLDSGVKAWPWQTPAQGLTSFNSKQGGNAAAIRELQACSDSDLLDLGIFGTSNTEAVMLGRKAIDNNSVRKVA